MKKYEFRITTSEIVHYDILVDAKNESEALDLAHQEITENVSWERIVSTNSGNYCEVEQLTFPKCDACDGDGEIDGKYCDKCDSWGELTKGEL